MVFVLNSHNSHKGVSLNSQKQDNIQNDIWRRRLWGLAGKRDDSGQALIITLVILMILALIPTLLASSVSSRSELTLSFQNGASAIAAVQAGLADYEGHMTGNDFYPAIYNSSDNYTDPSGDTKSRNEAFFQWVPVPQMHDEWYSYRVIPSPASLSGNGAPSYEVIVAGCSGRLDSLTSPCTGNGGNTYNRVDVISRQVQLTSPFFNAYFTKYELYDPNDPNYYPSSGSKPDTLPSASQVSNVYNHCVALASTSNAGGSFPAPAESDLTYPSEGDYEQNGGYGPDLSWTTTINGQKVGCRTAMWQSQTTQGPVTSMDNFFFCGAPNFESQVSSYRENPFWVPLDNSVWWLWYNSQQTCANKPVFGGNGYIQPISYQHLPSLMSYEQEAMVQPTDYSSAFGCYYQGSTTMLFHKDGTVQVSSPNSSMGTGPGQLDPGCPLGGDTSFGSGFNGAVFVANGGGDIPSVGPPPPADNCPDSSNQPWGPPAFELGWDPPNGNGFSGCWEPQEPSIPEGIDSANSPKGWLLNWETNDPASDGDLFVQGTITQNITLAAENNMYLVGSVCVPSDTVCQDTNHTGTNGEGNDGNKVSYTQDNLPSSGPVLGIVAGNMVKTYNPIATPSNNDPLDWGYSYNNTLKLSCHPFFPFDCSLSGGLWFQINLNFAGSGIHHESNLEGYPHENIVVDGVVFDLGGGTTTQQMPLADQAGASFAAMNTPNPFCHYYLLADVAAFFGSCPYGKVNSYPGLGNYDVNGASVEKFAPNLSCNQVTLWFIGNEGTCDTYTLLEIPYPGINLEVLDIGNSECPTHTSPPQGPPPGDGSWGPIWSEWHDLWAKWVFSYCIYLDVYQYRLSHTVGYTANFTYNPALAHGLPPGFPNPNPVSLDTSEISMTQVGSYFANNTSGTDILDG